MFFLRYASFVCNGLISGHFKEPRTSFSNSGCDDTSLSSAWTSCSQLKALSSVFSGVSLLLFRRRRFNFDTSFSGVEDAQGVSSNRFLGNKVNGSFTGVACKKSAVSIIFSTQKSNDEKLGGSWLLCRIICSSGEGAPKTSWWYGIFTDDGEPRITSDDLGMSRSTFLSPKKAITEYEINNLVTPKLQQAKSQVEVLASPLETVTG